MRRHTPWRSRPRGADRRLLGSNAQRARAWLAAFLAARGERAGAAELVAQVTAASSWTTTWPRAWADAYAQLGRPEEALRWLRQAADTGFPCRRWYARDSLLAPLGRTPAFEGWLDDLERREAEARAAP